MREKSYVARLGALALVLTLMTTCLTGGTLAKFVTEVEGEAEATVAAWEFKATGNNGAALSSIDMGRTAYKGETIGDNVIAPGTQDHLTLCWTERAVMWVLIILLQLTSHLSRIRRIYRMIWCSRLMVQIIVWAMK